VDEHLGGLARCSISKSVWNISFVFCLSVGECPLLCSTAFLIAQVAAVPKP